MGYRSGSIAISRHVGHYVQTKFRQKLTFRQVRRNQDPSRIGFVVRFRHKSDKKSTQQSDKTPTNFR